MFAVVPEGATLAETAVGSAVASNVGQKVIKEAPLIVPKVENLAAKGASVVGGEVKNLASKVTGSAAKNVASNTAKQVATNTAKQAAEGAVKESAKKKVFDAVVLGGLLPGVGFTAASNYLSKPSSDSNPDVTNGDLVDAHKNANGDHKKLMNHKFDNGKTFKEVQNNFIKDNKNELKKINGNKDLLYTKNNSPTPLHKQAQLHGISLNKNK